MALVSSSPYYCATSVAGVWEPRYSMVDAWRGLASLGVVFDHLGLNPGFNLGHACVMVFFVISGYCIAAATDSSTHKHLRLSEYMWRRFRRIYPPYFFALCLFSATRFVKMRAGMGNQLSSSLVAWIQNLTLTQWLSLVFHPASYPHQNTTLFVAGFWSLNYEEQFYVVMGLIMFAAVFLKKEMLGGILLLMIPAFVWNIYYPSRSYGFFLEDWVAFALGALVFYRLCRIADSFTRAAIDLGLLLLLLFSLYRNATLHFGQRSVYFEWICASAFALALVYLRHFDGKFKSSFLSTILGGFGLISYSLYLTHQSNLHSSEAIATRLIHWGLPPFSEFFIRVGAMCTIATIFWYFCERPFLNKPLRNDPQ
ncbi:MAG: acyltransferase [Terriglobales bacterium]